MEERPSPRRAPPEGDIRTMFDGLVERYDLVNSLLSLGLDGHWRRAAAAAIRIQPGSLVLDLGCGTGDLGQLLAGRARVVGVDLSHPMLLRAARKPGPPLALVQASAFRLPFADATFHAAVSAFVLRNLESLPRAFDELGRVLRSGAPVALLDITEPSGPILRRLFDAYLGAVAPALGALAGKREEYRYLARSLAHLPECEELCGELERAGFSHVSWTGITGGIVSLFAARRVAG